MSCESFAAEQLVKNFGGQLTSQYIWILYEEIGGGYGIHSELLPVSQLTVETI